MMQKQTLFKVLSGILATAAVIGFVCLIKYPIEHSVAHRTMEVQSGGQVKPRPPHYLYSIKFQHKQGIQAMTFGQGKLMVAYKGLHIIDTYSLNGKYEGSFPIAPDTRINPVSMAQNRVGSLYLCDMANRVVLVFGSEHKFRYPFPPRKIAPSSISFINAPGDVFVNRGNAFIIDMADKSVKVFTETGEFLMSIRNWGKAGEKFLHPAAVMQCADGRILVSDAFMKKVVVFNCAGKFAYFFEDPTEGFGQPVAMTIDSGGNIHVVDVLKEKVFVYDNYGRYLFAYGSSGSRAYQMRMPVDIVADPDGKHIFIADSGNQEIDVWGE